MDNLFQNNSGERSEHPLREMLLLFVDGELAAKEAAQLEVHLEACWPCRVKTQRIQGAIADIVEFDELVLTPRLLPPGGWHNFDRRLNQLVVTSGKQPLSSRLFGSLSRFFPVFRLSIISPSFRLRVVRYAAMTLVLLASLALLLYFKHEPTVSASELLNNAINAQAQLTHSISDPVIHQTIRVHRNHASESVSLEIWNDTRNSRISQFLTDGNHAVVIAGNLVETKNHAREVPQLTLVSELAKALEANHMDPQRPLSAASYQTWRNTLLLKQEEVAKTKLSSGADGLTLRTVPLGAVNEGQIAEAILTVRAADWHPVDQKLTVRAANGSLIYELSETESEVVSLHQVSPTIFGTEPPVVAKAETKPSPSLSPNAKVDLVNLSPTTATTVASVELEVEVLRLLHQVGADLGEQITVKRTAGGPVSITGIVETDQRKAEIAAALNPMAGNPAVQIDIQTFVETLAKQKQTASVSARAVTSEEVEIQSNDMAAEPELRAYFERRGANPEVAARQFAAGMVGGSLQAMQHLGALRRMVNQFSLEQLRTLTPEARAKWLSLIWAHAQAYQQKSAALRRDLKPIFFPGATEELPTSRVIRSDADLRQAVQELFATGFGNYQVIRSAFTVTSERARFTVINTPQFWQAMKQAEALAASLANAQ